MNTAYDVKYYTHNVYEESVREAFYSLLITPCQNETQTVLNVTYSNSLKAEPFAHANPFGFEVTSLYTAQPFMEFEFGMTATVAKSSVFIPMMGMMSVEEEQKLLEQHHLYIDHHLYLGSSPYTQIDEASRSRLLFRRADQSVYNFLMQLNNFIYNMLEFDPEPTHVHTTVSEVLQLNRGVCQDYTHLFIGIARLNKIPCRYVSGYLNQGLNLTGTAVMHAWAEAFIPGHCWHGFDPTNNLLADVNYIKAAHGVDYSDCSPLRGMLRTNGGHTTSYGVKITPNLMAEAAQ